MKKLTFIMTVVLVVFLTISASANSLMGTKGLIFIPTADTMPLGKLGIGFQMVGTGENNISLDYGLGDNFEVFVNLKNDSNSQFSGGIKARVMRETRLQPSLSVGLKNRYLFVVASKTMDYKTNIRGHLGFGTGDATDGFDGVFFGFNKLINPVNITSSNSSPLSSLIPATNFKVEFFRNDINLGVDFLLNENFVLNVGVVDFQEFTYGIGYSDDF